MVCRMGTFRKWLRSESVQMKQTASNWSGQIGSTGGQGVGTQGKKLVFRLEQPRVKSCRVPRTRARLPVCFHQGCTNVCVIRTPARQSA